MDRRVTDFVRMALAVMPLVILWLGVTPAQAQVGSPAVLDTGYVIVKFHDHATPADKAAVHASFNAALFKEIPELNVHVVQVSDATTTQAVAAAYRGHPLVEYAEPDALVPFSDASIVTPNDPLLGNQWQHTNIQSRNAWAVTTGSSATRITVCDTGVSPTHPDLQASLRTDLGFNTADNSTNWGPVHWHGTAVAGSAAAIGNNSTGVAGVSWASEIVPVRVTNLLSGSAFISDMADCLVYGANVGSDVINLSYQTYSGGSIFSTIIAAADYADTLGSVVVVSAGNENTNPAPNQDPASIVYAAATTSSNTKASFSNFGNFVDIAAPGVSVYTTFVNVSCNDANGNGVVDPGESCSVTGNSYAAVSGTSFSAPITAGGVLLVRSANSTLSAAATRSTLFQSATDLGTLGEDATFGAGLLNVHAAAHQAATGPGSLTVIAPNGGESWAVGSSQTIQWTSSGVSGNVGIDLSRDGGATWSTLFAGVPNTGSQSWSVTGPVTSQARIRVRSVDVPGISDTSDANFTIAASLTVIAPNGGESWAVGSSQTIQWTFSGVSGNLRIDLSRDGGVTWTTLFANVHNTGAQAWTVTGPATAQALIRITSMTTPSVSDVSNASFVITGGGSGASLTVTVPNGGESWAVGSAQTIQWTSSGLTGNVLIELSRNGGSTWEILFASVPNSGAQSWTVTGPATTQARVRITSLTTPSVSDVSNAAFAITGGGSSSLTVITPNGGESWAEGTTQMIRWSSSGVSGNVKIDLSRNGGATWTTLFSSTANDGVQSWNVSGPATTQARVRITSVATPSVSDVNDANFTITGGH